MQDLFQNYVDDLGKFREALHDELKVQAQELSKAIGIYARDCESALSTFMEKISARGAELEAAAAARFDYFRGLPISASPAEATGEPLPPATTNSDQERVAAVAEQAVAEGLDIESDGDRKQKFGRPMLLVKSDPAA